jgi:hypothetical protein
MHDAIAHRVPHRPGRNRQEFLYTKCTLGNCSHGKSLRRKLKLPGNKPAAHDFGFMKTKVVLMVAMVTGLLSLVVAGYCFWLMNVPLSYRWVPVVITGFLLGIFVFSISLITSLIALIQLRRLPRAPDPPQIRSIT